MGVSVSIDGYDLFSDYGCILTNFEIGTPEAQTKYVEIPLRNGALDLSELLTGSVRYNNRSIRMKFMSQILKQFPQKFSDILNQFHGKSCEIIFDRDRSYYYQGRLNVTNYNNLKYGGTFEIEAYCDPFKYNVSSSNGDWLWDPFDFEEGYINNLSDLTVDGSLEVTIIAEEQLTYATVTSDSQMTVTYGDDSVTITSGTTTLYDFEFASGENTLTFTGSGTISIDYRGAKL